MPRAIYYHFQQRFNVSARKACEWCTNYATGDHSLMGEKNASRKVEQFTDLHAGGIIVEMFQERPNQG